MRVLLASITTAKASLPPPGERFFDTVIAALLPHTVLLNSRSASTG
jgi:hypothetical protein